MACRRPRSTLGSHRQSVLQYRLGNKDWNAWSMLQSQNEWSMRQLNVKKRIEKTHQRGRQTLAGVRGCTPFPFNLPGKPVFACFRLYFTAGTWAFDNLVLILLVFHLMLDSNMKYTTLAASIKSVWSDLCSLITGCLQPQQDPGRPPLRLISSVWRSSWHQSQADQAANQVH